MPGHSLIMRADGFVDTSRLPPTPIGPNPWDDGPIIGTVSVRSPSEVSMLSPWRGSGLIQDQENAVRETIRRGARNAADGVGNFVRDWFTDSPRSSPPTGPNVWDGGPVIGPGVIVQNPDGTVSVRDPSELPPPPPPPPPRDDYGPYGSPVGPTNTLLTPGAANRFSANVLTNTYEDALAQQAAILDFDISAIKAQYNGPMDQLQGVLDDLAEQGQLSDAAYGRYSAAVNAIDPTVEQKGIEASDAPEDVTRIYDDAEGALFEALKGIDSSLGPEVANAVSDDMRYLEGYIQDALRTNLDNVDDLHAAAGVAAARLSELGYADNAFEAAKQQGQLEAQLAKEVENQREAIERLQAEMNSAIERARERSALETPTLDLNYQDSLDASMLEYFRRKGLTEVDVAKMMAAYEAIKGTDVTALLNEQNWQQALSTWNTSYILQQIGLSTDINQWLVNQDALAQQYKVDGLDEEAASTEQSIAAMEKWLKTVDLGKLYASPGAVDSAFNVPMRLGVIDRAQVFTASKIGFDNSNEWMIKDDDQWNNLRDAYTIQQTFDSNWAEIKSRAEQQAAIVQEQYAERAGGNTSGSHKTAANNYGNRYTKDYVYRRTVTAPYYASMVKSKFAGTEIGGLRYIRPPSDVGGGKIVNSDHQSGGAFDVYSKGGSGQKTNQQLLRIAAWFRTQAGVSYVTYEGQGKHQTGGNNAHVHVSFRTDFKVP